MADPYVLPPWLTPQGNEGTVLGNEIMRGRELKQRQNEQNFYQSQQPSIGQQAEMWRQKQEQYQKQADMLAQRAVQEQEYQKGVSDLQTRSQIPPGQPGAMTPQQLQTQAALLQMKRMSGAGGSSAAVMNALKPAPSLEPLTIPGAATPKTMPSPGYTDKLNSILQTAGKPPIAAPAAPPAAYSFGNRLVTPKELAPPAAPRAAAPVRPMTVPEGSEWMPEDKTTGRPGYFKVPQKAATSKVPAAGAMTAQQKARWADVKQERNMLMKEIDEPLFLALPKDQADKKEKRLEELNGQMQELEEGGGTAKTSPAVQTATNPKTGQKLEFVDGKWQPIQP
jgi:hypothetical protein